MDEGGLIDGDDCWILRFHQDIKAWVRDPKVLMDHGMATGNGETPAEGTQARPAGER